MGLDGVAIRIYEEILTGIRKYVAKYEPKLDSLGVDTWRIDFGLLDKNGKLLGLPYQYLDKKNDGSAEINDSVLGNRQFYELTGIQLLFINTLNQIVDSQRQDDPILDIAENLLLIGDLLHYFLTGRIATEWTTASGKKVNQIHITGGGSKNPMFNQFTANALNRKVLCGPVEATAIGNIMMQAYGLGLYHSLDEIRTLIMNSIKVSEYTPRDEVLWQDAYQHFVSITNPI